MNAVFLHALAQLVYTLVASCGWRWNRHLLSSVSLPSPERLTNDLEHLDIKTPPKVLTHTQTNAPSRGKLDPFISSFLLFFNYHISIFFHYLIFNFQFINSSNSPIFQFFIFSTFQFFYDLFYLVLFYFSFFFQLFQLFNSATLRLPHGALLPRSILCAKTWRLGDLAKEVDLPPGVVQKKMMLWVNQGVISESPGPVYRLIRDQVWWEVGADGGVC